MKIIKEETKTIETVEDIICNICEESLRPNNSYPGFVGKSFTYVGGFASDILGDMSKFEWDVCEKCLAEWFKTFKINPKKSEEGPI